jgi:hypothetical protein
MTDWYAKELLELRDHPLVTLHIYSTCSSTPSHPSTPYSYSDSSADISADGDIEKQPEKVLTRPSLDLKSGRPDLPSMITTLVRRAGKEERISVSACGPESMMLAVREVVAECITADGPSMELHIEQFGF